MEVLKWLKTKLNCIDNKVNDMSKNALYVHLFGGITHFLLPVLYYMSNTRLEAYIGGFIISSILGFWWDRLGYPYLEYQAGKTF